MVWKTVNQEWEEPTNNSFNRTFIRPSYSWTVDNNLDNNTMWVAPSSGQLILSADEPIAQPATQTIVGTAATHIHPGDLVTITCNGTSGTGWVSTTSQTFASGAVSSGIWSVNTSSADAAKFVGVPFTVAKYKPLTKTQKKKLEVAQRKAKKKRLREDKQLKLAHERSMKLLKKWLTKNEWDALINKGELEIKSKINNDEIYIVKKAAYEKVLKKKSGKLVSQHCLVTEKHYPDGDVLLNKILLLKTDEEAFLKTAVKTDLNNGYYNGNLGHVYVDWSNASVMNERFHVNYEYPHPEQAQESPRPEQLTPEQRQLHVDVDVPLPAHPKLPVEELPIPNGMTRSPLINRG